MIPKFESSAGAMSLRYSTFLGGSGGDDGRGIDADSAGNVYVTGHTGSANFPIVNAYQHRYGGRIADDAYVTKLAPDGSRLLYSTYLGGDHIEAGESVVVDHEGNAYVTGYTFSSNFPVVYPIQSTSTGYSDLFVTKLAPGGHLLIYSTYLGGNSTDVPHDITLDVAGNVWIIGETVSFNFPVAGNAVQGTKAGEFDAFAARVDNACRVTFADVPANSPFYPYVQCIACRAIVSGYNGGIFLPNAHVTRGPTCQDRGQCCWLWRRPRRPVI